MELDDPAVAGPSLNTNGSSKSHTNARPGAPGKDSKGKATNGLPHKTQQQIPHHSGRRLKSTYVSAFCLCVVVVTCIIDIKYVMQWNA